MKIPIFLCVLSLSALILSAFSTIPVSIFNAVISFNGKVQPLGTEDEILTRDGRAYVPVRYIGEHMGAVVGYDNEQKEITIQYLEEKPLKSAIHTTKQEGNLELTIFSEKVSYTKDEIIRIWAKAENIGNSDLTVHTGNPLFTFSIQNVTEEKPSLFEIQNYSLETVQFAPRDEYRRQLELRRLVKTPDELATLSLPVGTYIVNVAADYSIEGNRKQLSSDITIEIVH